MNDSELAAWAEYNPLMARLMRDLYGEIDKPANPLKDATPAPAYGVANREGSEL